MPLSNPASGASLTSVDYPLGADVTMTNADQFYDGPSGSFSSGTWLILWRVLILVSTNATQAITAKLWDGTTVYDEMEFEYNPGQSFSNTPLAGFTVETFGSSTTVKVSVISARNTGTINRDGEYNSASIHKASRITAVKIA